MLAAGTRRHKLSEADVLLIRERYAAGGVTQQALADEFGVNQTNIGFIVRNVRWRHLAY
jgi:DNA-binding XRE family transcriptional regulator